MPVDVLVLREPLVVSLLHRRLRSYGRDRHRGCDIDTRVVDDGAGGQQLAGTSTRTPRHSPALR
jgi:hypothetical protein